MKILLACAVLVAFCAEASALPKVCYTRWFDRDDPSGMGDYETLVNLRKEYPNKICLHPLTIQAVTLAGVPAQNTGQVFQAYDTVTGFACVNSQQKKGRCLDYEVRFGCPCPWPPLKPIPVDLAVPALLQP